MPTSCADLAQTSLNHHMDIPKPLAWTEYCLLPCTWAAHDVAAEHLRHGQAELRRVVSGTQDFPALALKKECKISHQ